MFFVLKCLTQLLFDVCKYSQKLIFTDFFPPRTEEIQVDALHEQTETAPDEKCHLINLSLDICLWPTVLLKVHQFKQVPIQEQNIEVKKM